MRVARGIGAVLLAATAAHAQLWNTGAFDGVDGRPSDHPSLPVRPDTRAADDFLLPAGNGRNYSITSVHARVLAKNYTSTFAEIYADQAGQPIGAPIATLTQQSLTVLQSGVFGQYNLLDAAFAPTTLALPPGRYWLAVAVNVSGAAAPNDGYGFFATAGHGTILGLQAMYRTGTGPWTAVSVAFGNPSDFSFRIDGQQAQPPPPNCYPNCDNSTTLPVLNVSDFLCFQQHFANGDSYANCDHSTLPPVLNLLDYICFQQKFSAGCT